MSSLRTTTCDALIVSSDYGELQQIINLYIILPLLHVSGLPAEQAVKGSSRQDPRRVLPVRHPPVQSPRQPNRTAGKTVCKALV